MSLGTDMSTDFIGALGEVGQQVRFRYFTFSGADAGYDDDGVAVKSGTDVYVSGLFFPVQNKFGSTESVLMEQGKLLSSDKILFVAGSVSTSGLFTVGPGSPTPNDEYRSLDLGISTPLVNDVNVYNKLYLRRLTTGSLFGNGS